MQGMHVLSVRGLVADHPISSAVELAQFLQQQCGAEGYRIDGPLLLALRWDGDGNEIIVERFQWQAAN